MADPATKKRLALDTNIIYDLAEERDFAFTFVEVFREKKYELLLPPTSVQELAHAIKHRKPGADLARRGLVCLREWGIWPFDLISVGHGITEQFSLLLRSRDLLPPSECNDGFILAETSLAGIPMLATSDSHLLNIPEESLNAAFDAQDLNRVVVCHPKKLLRAVGE